MLAELAAANAAFGIIKSFVSNGKELTGCAKQISDFVFSKEQIEKNLKKKKAKGIGGNDLEEFMALEQIREKEEELKKNDDLSRQTGIVARLAGIPSRS